MNDETRERDRTLFGRRHGRALRARQAAELESGLAFYAVDLTRPPPDPLTSLFAVPVTSVYLEIGFGGGEHLLHHARQFPDTGFIGAEPFINGMAKLQSTLARAPLSNVRVYNDDAAHLLDWLPPESLSGVDLLYPDPWPKKKHWKRRFVGPANLNRLERAMRPGAPFRFASDIDSYINWTLLACRAHPAFEWQAASPNDWREPYPGWPGTRYEAKALRASRTPAYLTFVRR